MTDEQVNVFNEFKVRRDELRPETVSEPSWVKGVLWPTLSFRTGKSPEDLLTEGVMGWTRIAMAVINTSGDALGWERFFTVLDKEQRPVSERKAQRLIKEFNIEGDAAADAVNLMVTWAKGDLFNWHRLPRVSEHHIEGIGDWCPQVQAVEEMGMGERATNMKLWCDHYDSQISQSINNDIRMVHGHCMSSGDKYCMFSVTEEKDPPEAKTPYQVIKFFNDKKKEELDAEPDPDYFEGMAAPRNLETWSEAAKLKDGLITKAKIALETLLVAGMEYGWEKYINLFAKEHSWGYRQEAFKLKREFNIQGDTIRDAGNLLAIGYGLLGFDHHSFNKYTPDVVEGVASKCQIIDTAEELGIMDKVEDVSVWCDFYHNHKVKAVNDNFQVTHTHCLGCGDKYCRFVLKDITATSSTPSAE